MRNKFLELMLISLNSASWELHQYSRRMCGPMKISKLTPAPGNRTRDPMIVRPMLYLTTTDTKRKCFGTILREDWDFCCCCWKCNQRNHDEIVLAQGIYSPTILNNILILVLQICLCLETFEFSIFRSNWMKHNFWLAKPYGLAKYGLANQKFCYIQIYKSLWKKKKLLLLLYCGLTPL